MQGSLRVTDTTYTTDLIVSGSKTAKYVLAAPNAAAGAPTWRALTNSDVGLGSVENTKLSTWAGTTNIKTVGTITSGTWNGTAIGVGYGGTGKTSWTQWGVLYASATNALANTAAGTAGYLLQGNGAAAPSWINATSDKTNNTIVKRNSSGGFVAGSIAVDSIMMSRTSGQYISISSNNVGAGELTLSTRGTTSAEGWVTLELGNTLASTVAENASGRIKLYHSDGGVSTISAAFDSIATTTKAVKIDTGLSVVNSIETTTGFLYVRKGSIWAGTTADTTGERDVGARAGSGSIYLYAAAATTGNKGLYASSATNGGAQILTVNQSGQISGLTSLVTPLVLNSGSQITFNERGGQAIYAGPNDAAHNPGGALNNLVISSWYGVSFTTALTGQTYSGTNAVSINCRTGTLAAGGQIVSMGAGEKWVEAQNTTYGNRICLDVSANGQTSGIWSSGYVNGSGAYTAGAKWLLYRNANNATVIGDSLWTTGNIYPGGTGSWYFGSNGAIQGWIMDLVAVTPYIDFHYNNSAADYTFRILNDSSDRLVFQTAGISTYCIISNSSSESTMGAWSGSNTIYLYNKGERGLYTNGGGKICYTDTSNKITVRYHTLSNLSSRRIKENIYPISDNDALSILHINPVYFNYKKGYGSQEKTIGVIAEEVEQFVRYIVTEDEDPINPTLKLKGVSYDKFIPYLIKLAQIQQREITNLKSQIQEYMASNAQNES